jgi:hypothetical protein
VLVTFQTKAHADITMFGRVAVELLKLAGMTGTVPTAILAADVPGVLAALESALDAHRGAHGESAPGDADTRASGEVAETDAAPAVPLRNRALPLIGLLRAAGAAQADVLVLAR